MSAGPIDQRRPAASFALRDVAAVVAVAGAMAAEALWFPHEGRAMPAYGWLLIVSTALPVLARRRRPVAAMTLSLAVLLPLTWFCPVVQTAPIAGMLCGYWLAKLRGRRLAIVAVSLITPYVFFLLAIHDPEKLLSWEMPKNLAFVLLPLVLGLTTRYRDESMAALVARAEDAERSREQEAERRVGLERMRIAREVHDVVSHSMVAINVQAGVGAHLIDKDPERARQSLHDIRRVSSEALEELRGILGILRSGDLGTPIEPTVTLETLPDLVAGMRSAGMDVTLTNHVSGPVPAPAGLTAARVVQEGLTNAMRHAASATVRIDIRRADGTLDVEVVNGPPCPGFPALKEVPTGAGIGLLGLRERVQAIGGRLDVGPTDDAGWRVHARIPAASAAAGPAAHSGELLGERA